MSDPLHALRASVERLRSIIEPLSEAELDAPAYPTQWTIGDVISHIGSGAVIMRARVENTVAGTDPAAEFNQTVWDEWNAKPNADRRIEAIAADRALLDTFEGVTNAQRSAFEVTLGPMTLDLEQFATLRLNEHAVHTWDIEVVLDPEATIGAPATDLVVDNLQFVGRFGGKPDGAERTITVVTTSPARRMTVVTTPDSVSVQPSEGDGAADLEIPAEAFIRLVYGRLDPAHTPAGSSASGVQGNATLHILRAIFTGI